MAHVPQFTISWKYQAKKDDGLWDNPCWPKAITPNDPGFALSENGPWYTQTSKYPAYNYGEAYAPGTIGPSNGPAARKRRDWMVEGTSPSMEVSTPRLR